MAEMIVDDLHAAFEDDFLHNFDGPWMEWRNRYLAFISEVDKISKEAFYEPEFQRRLWEDDSITGIGPGNSFSVESAYTDPAVIDKLWSVKSLDSSISTKERGRALQETYEELIEYVANNHSPSGKRPWARLSRLFAALRPYDVMCIVSGTWLKTLHRALGRKFGPYTRFLPPVVETSDFLFEELGLEKSLTNVVDVNLFAWWLATKQQEKQDEVAGVQSPPMKFSTATDQPSLTILAPEAQRKGLFYVTDNIPLLLTIVEAATEGATREELRELILSTSPTLNASSANNVLNQAKALGLLRIENHTYYLTQIGEELRDGEPPHQVLFPNMVRRFFGFAHILAIMRDANWAITKATLLERMRETYPSWTTNFMPSQLTTWMVQLGLFEYDRDKEEQLIVRATEDGQFWASGIPEDMTQWYVSANDDEHDMGEDKDGGVDLPSAGKKLEQPDFPTIQKYFDEENLILPDGFLQRLHSAFHSMDTKRFVLLTGLSGTGKTSIARAYARAYCRAMGISGKHYCEVPVWPDWTDPTGLLGFVNPLHDEPTYQTTEALTFLIRASKTPDKPFFLCLDEMNLARVEHYFAPFLSAMEGKPGSQVLKLHSFEGRIDSVEAEIRWPQNLFIFGTVNMDETTYPFSDKVLDRAFPFELWEVNKDAWRDKRTADTKFETDLVNAVFEVLSQVYDALLPIRRHFGYRVFDEVLYFCSAWPEKIETSIILDAAVYAKILPKIRGDDTESFSSALGKLETICVERNLNQCAGRIQAMRTELAAIGFVRFWS